MAEATVLASGGQRKASPILQQISKFHLKYDRIETPVSDQDSLYAVGCGRPVEGSQIEIVDPHTYRVCKSGSVGEIWIKGAHVAQGYWMNPEATATMFQAKIKDSDQGPFLRTGDLGFFSEEELFITGRLKDIIIIRGANFYPQDIEKVAEKSHLALRSNCSAVFTVEEGAQSKLVLIIEVERSYRHNLDVQEVVGSIREAVVREFDEKNLITVVKSFEPKLSGSSVEKNVYL